MNASRGWILLPLVVLPACRLLDVEEATRVPASIFESPARAASLVEGTIADFECAYTNYVAATALLTDELSSASANQPRTWERRAVISTTPAPSTGDCTAYSSFTLGFGYGLYTPLSTARFVADSGFLRIQSFPADVPLRDSYLATLAAYAGYAHTLFGEAYCWSAFDGGPPRSPAEALALAEQRFTTAIGHAQAAGNTDILNMALVGRARVLLDLGRGAEAAADAALVPSGYVRYASRGTESIRRENVVFFHNWEGGHTSADARYRGLTVGGVPDPRVGAYDSGTRGTDGATIIWRQTKYDSKSDPIPIASWDEAQLIIAEALGGQEAVDAINRLRAKVSLPAYSSADPVAIAQQVREERRRELYLEGHRLNDMLRWDLPFQTGTGYGTTARLPLPQIEIDNNPNMAGLNTSPPWRCQR